MSIVALFRKKVDQAEARTRQAIQLLREALDDLHSAIDEYEESNEEVTGARSNGTQRRP